MLYYIFNQNYYHMLIPERMQAHIAEIDNIKKKNIISICLTNIYINVVVVVAGNELNIFCVIVVVDVDADIGEDS